MARRASILTALLLTLAAVAQAHGPAPSPLRVLHVEGGQALIVQTNIGLALRTGPDHFEYGCPSQWGDLETPLMASLGADVLMAVGPDAIFVSEDRGCNFAPIEDTLDLEEPRVSALIAAQGRIWGVEKGREASRVFVWSQEAGLTLAVEIAQPIDSLMAVDGGLLLAGARPEPALYRVDVDSLEAALMPFEPPSAVGVQRLSLRFVDPGAETRWWMAATTDDGIELWRTEDGGRSFVSALSGELSMHGPAPLCGGFVGVVDGQMMADPAFEPTCDFDGLAEKRLNCLGVRDGLVWTCELRQLFQIDVQGEVADLKSIFSFEELGPPTVACPGEMTARLECEQDWLHFGGESGLLDPEDIFGTGGDPDPMPEPESEPGVTPEPNGGSGGGGGGCATALGQPVGGLWFMLVGLGAIGWVGRRPRPRRRRREI